MKIYIKRLLIFFLTVAVLLFLYLFAKSYFFLKQVEYTVDSFGCDFKIVQLTDLHDSVFGKDNKRLIEKVKEASPDIIAITGDMVNGEDTEFSDIINLVSNLGEIAPVYYSIGNHEERLSCGLDNFIGIIEETGAIVLEKEYRDIEINGTKIRIGGTSGYGLSVPFWEASYGKKAEDYWDDESFSEQRFLLEFEKTDSYKILLLHKPGAATFWAEDGYYDVDLVLSGHTHGGQVILPFIGGIYAPDEGWFPKYEYGLFYKNDINIIVSSGLGCEKGIFRLNNIPEITVVTVN